MPQASDPPSGINRSGINSWLEDELHYQYEFDRNSVDEGWTSLFQSDLHQAGSNGDVRSETATAPQLPNHQ